jgi:hypothetical protein
MTSRDRPFSVFERLTGERDFDLPPAKAGMDAAGGRGRGFCAYRSHGIVGFHNRGRIFERSMNTCTFCLDKSG